jgi:transcriptional regulator with XRE-family HTH domain
MKKITQKRKELGLTQKQVAEKLGLRKATISDFETGKTTLNLDNFLKYLRLLNLTTEERINAHEEEANLCDKRYNECQKRIDEIDRKIEVFIKDMSPTEHIHSEVIKECKNHNNEKDEIMLECDDFTVMVYLSITDGVIRGAEHMGQYEEIGTRNVKVINIEATYEDGSKMELPEKTRQFIEKYYNEW